MNDVRYGLALLLTLALPPAYLFWLGVHPFIHFWRRVGPFRTYLCLGTLYVLAMIALFLVRAPLLGVDFGASHFCIGVGVLCLCIGMWFRIVLGRQLRPWVLLGLPELSPDEHPGALLTEGVYARIRHPRYIEGTLSVLGCALIANYLAPYVIIALSIPMFAIIIRFEERELGERFGAAYHAYCERVPRFIPRRPRAGAK